MENSAVTSHLGVGLIVNIVLWLLVLASVASWTIIFAKWVAFKQARKETQKFLDLFWNAKSLDSIFNASKDYSNSPVCNIFRAGFLEFQKVSSKVKGKEGAAASDLLLNGVENVERSLRRSSLAEVIRLERLVPFLASIASVAPFIGLFGTVIGIMDAFSALSSNTGAASIQVVGPGISEALMATAVGLFAAIPALMAYNQASVRMRHFRADMDNFSSDFVNILKRNYLG
ncbi:MAG TPA: protein TolQ [Bdellovibrionota bacterium]|jgi:biopolymer transport protein TolQ|nr:protein TolQ [Bdellovibrionota bacterium]